MEATTLNGIGNVYSSLGDYERALKSYGLALSLKRTLGDRGGEASALAGMARAERDRGNLLQAQRDIEDALAIIESLRTNLAIRSCAPLILRPCKSITNFMSSC